MLDTKLETHLRSLVRRYGLGQVKQCLGEIGLSSSGPETSNQDSPGADGDTVTKSVNKKNVKVTATEYVSKLECTPEKKQVMIELAKRFQDKCFLPTFGDISNFCRVCGIDEPVSKSRANAIPRVFKFISTMDTDVLQRMLDDEMFSGPSRLAPISDAIRSNGRGSARNARGTRNFFQ